MSSLNKYFHASKTSPQRSSTKLIAFGGHRLITCRNVTILSKYNGKKYNIEFEILDQDAPSIFGLPTAVELNLIKHIYTVDKQTKPNNSEFYKNYKDILIG